MAATTSSASPVPVQPVFTDADRLALAGFLAGYRGLTREANTLDLRQFTAWCRVRSLPLFSARRADIETFARELESLGRARATVTRRLCTWPASAWTAMRPTSSPPTLPEQRGGRARQIRKAAWPPSDRLPPSNSIEVLTRLGLRACTPVPSVRLRVLVPARLLAGGTRAG